MKGLILKDLYNLWKYYKFFLLVVIAFLVAGCALSQVMFFIPYAMLFISLLPITFLSMDEKCGWSRFCDAMPVSRAQFVSAKYLLALILLAAVVIISAITIIVTGLDKEQLISMLSISCATLMVIALTLPFSFAFGPDKGRYAGIIFVCFIAAYFGTGGKLPAVDLSPYIPLAGIALFAVSWLASIPLYQWHRKKQG